MERKRRLGREGKVGEQMTFVECRVVWCWFVEVSCFLYMYFFCLIDIPPAYWVCVVMLCWVRKR